MTYGTVGNVVP